MREMTQGEVIITKDLDIKTRIADIIMKEILRETEIIMEITVTKEIKMLRDTKIMR
jgi:hypothetical protein